MYQWLRKNLANQLKFDVKLNQIVLTLPSPLQEELDRKKFSKMIHAFMKMHKIQSYGYSVQFRRSHNPLGTRRLHAHCLTLNIKDENNKIVQNDYYFDVDSMRDTWKRIIKKHTGFEPSPYRTGLGEGSGKGRHIAFSHHSWYAVLTHLLLVRGSERGPARVAISHFPIILGTPF